MKDKAKLLLALIWTFTASMGITNLLNGQPHETWHYIAPILNSFLAVFWFTWFLHDKVSWEMLKK